MPKSDGTRIARRTNDDRIASLEARVERLEHRITQLSAVEENATSAGGPAEGA
jgi:hypothetical protein